MINYMLLALELAKSAINQTMPNPSVGAVIVRDNKIVGLGCHLFAGGHHAEIYAINMNTEMARDATMYVTLEPCSHHGRTPPCTDAIIKAGIKRVIVAMLDPNPLVSGNGVRKLRNAGIEVEVGLFEDEAKKINEKYFYHIVTKMPYVTLITRMSLDSKLATAANEIKSSISEEVQSDISLYQTTHNAILIEANTIINEASLLIANQLRNKQNTIIVILDQNLSIPLTSEIINNGLSQIWMIVNKTVSDAKIQAYLEHKQVRILRLDTNDLTLILKELYTLGISAILVDGCSQIYNRFIQNKLFNQLVLYIVPKLIGGTTTSTFFAGEGFRNLADALQVSITETIKLGNDLKIIAHSVERKK